jgi:beta-N-acetylglucosaminidase/uncharacterized protein YjdB
MKQLSLWVLNLTLLFTLTLPVSAETSDNSSNVVNSTPVVNVLIDNSYKTAIAKTDYTLSSHVTYDTYQSAKQAMDTSSEQDMVVLDSAGKIVAMKKGLVILVSSSTVSFSSSYYGLSTYVTNNVTAYYRGTNTDLTVKVSISGYTGNVAQDKTILIPDAYIARGQTTNRYFFDYYQRSGSEYSHILSYYSTGNQNNYSRSFTVEKAPSFMVENVKYYSIDGVKYYLSPYDAINPDKAPVGIYYPYFKYLSYRTQTSYTAEEINRYISYANNSFSASIQSVLLNKGQAFLDNQNRFGVNAVMELAFANLESNYGKSYYATARYNLFGINAVDTNPDNAEFFLSVDDCIYEHTKNWLNGGYFDAYAYIDWTKPAGYYDTPGRIGFINDYSGDSRYLGSFPGNKAGGVTVKYASDPYHGEKIGGLAYRIDKYLGSKDYNKWQRGVTNKATYAYLLPSTTSWKLYRYSTNVTRDKSTAGPLEMPVIILGSQGDFYKVQAEMPINADGRAYFDWEYDFNRSVAYVLKSDITLISNQLPNSSALQQLINETKTLDRDIYTTTSLTSFDTALQAALTTLNTLSSSQSDIDNAYNNLYSAYYGLVKIPITIAITNISLNQTDQTITNQLGIIQLNPTITPSNATLKALLYTSSNSNVASISADGAITLKANGETTITATTKDGSNISTSFKLTIAIPEITSQVYTINPNNQIISNLPIGLDLTTFIGNINSIEGSTLKVFDNTTEVTSGILKTGMTITMSVNNQVVQTLTLAINGDSNKDGKLDISDYVMMRDVLLGKTALSVASFVAADLNRDSNINISDYVLLRDILLKR